MASASQFLCRVMRSRFNSLSRSGFTKLGLPQQYKGIADNSSALQCLHTSSCRTDIFNVQDEKDFKDKVLESCKPVVVEFHATWCSPCKILMPRLESVVTATDDKVDLAKVDIDQVPEIAMNYNVGAVPSVLGMVKGDIVFKFVGVKDEDQIETYMAKLKE